MKVDVHVSRTLDRQVCSGGDCHHVSVDDGWPGDFRSIHSVVGNDPNVAGIRGIKFQIIDRFFVNDRRYPKIIVRVRQEKQIEVVSAVDSV